MDFSQDTLIGFIIGFLLVAITRVAMVYFFGPESDVSSAIHSDDEKASAGFKVNAGKVDDLKPGSMIDAMVGDSGMKILVVKTADGEIYATGSKCTHYGAPLKKGVLCQDRIVCPWHAASFNCKTGDIEDGPVIDALPTYDVTITTDDEIIVHVPKIDKRMRRVPDMCEKDESSTDTYVVIGGGPAGAAAVESLRSEGYSGRVVFITKEKFLPYDRVKLSKAMNINVDKITLRDADFYSNAGIETMLGREVLEVDTDRKVIQLDQDETIEYSKVLLATGTFCRSFQKPEGFTIPGADLGNIYTMRYPSDAKRIESEITSSDVNVVIVGSSFIGMEAAAYLKKPKKVKNITVVGMENVPFERVLGYEIGERLMELHESQGINFSMKTCVGGFIGDGAGKVETVILKDTNGNEISQLKCDVVIIGAGVIPATQYLKGVELGPMGCIKVDETLKVKGATDVWAAGDIAMYPYWVSGEEIRVEHYDVAMQQGRVAAKNMAIEGTLSSTTAVAFHSVPFFWTSQYNINIRYAGHARLVDEVIIEGDLEALKFVAYFVTTGKVISAVVTVGADPVAVAAQQLMQIGQMPSPEELKGSGLMACVDVLEASGF